MFIPLKLNWSVITFKSILIRWERNLLSIIMCCIVVSSCEMSRTVPLDPPAYKPQLMIHCLASPQSGAQAVIRYNKPLGEEHDELIPPLPQIEAWLLMGGERIQAFEKDSTGYFSIAADDLTLEPGSSYAMEVVDQTNDRTYISGSSPLPEQPAFLSATAKRDSDYFVDYALEIILDGVDRPVDAISVFPVLLDSVGLPVGQVPGETARKYKPWNKVKSRVHYNNAGIWTEKELLFRLRGGYQDKNDEYVNADHVNIAVVYLSEDLTRFVRDLAESYFSGEDIFQMVRPVYSNFQKAAGIFGLYNEVELEVEIEE